MKRFIGILVGFCLVVVAISVYTWYSNEDYKEAGVPVLNYHSVNNEKLSPLVVQTEHFEDDMRYLKQEGYHTVTMDDLYGYYKEGKELPSKPVLITFDDGYIDNYREAFPILKKYGLKATLFMIGDAVGQKRFVNAQQLQEMDRNGFEIQGHTYRHHSLVSMSDEDIQKDLSQSTEVLASIVGHPITYLAYPGGFYDKRVEEQVAKSGYKLAFTIEPGFVTPGEAPMALPRLSIFEGSTHPLALKMRLHLKSLIRVSYNIRHYLTEHGFHDVASYVPTF